MPRIRNTTTHHTIEDDRQRASTRYDRASRAQHACRRHAMRRRSSMHIVSIASACSKESYEKKYRLTCMFVLQRPVDNSCIS